MEVPKASFSFKQIMAADGMHVADVSRGERFHLRSSDRLRGTDLTPTQFGELPLRLTVVQASRGG